MSDDRVFGDLDSFRAQFTQPNQEQAFVALRSCIAPIGKRTLRQQVQKSVAYTARRTLVEELTSSTEDREPSALVADYLRRPNLKPLLDEPRQPSSLVLWKLLASSLIRERDALAQEVKALRHFKSLATNSQR